jgi:hypothetical protein
MLAIKSLRELHSLMSYFIKIRFNIILPSTSSRCRRTVPKLLDTPHTYELTQARLLETFHIFTWIICRVRCDNGLNSFHTVYFILLCSGMMHVMCKLISVK